MTPGRSGRGAVTVRRERRGIAGRKALGLAIAIAAVGVLPMLPAEAALPPEHQRIREFQAILTSDAVLSTLRYEPIEMIRYAAPDLYEVHAGFCWLEVRIVNDPSFDPEPGWAGPRQFIIELGETMCE